MRVDVVLPNGSNDHGSSATHETGEYFLDGSEADAHVGEGGLHKLIEDGDEDDESEWVDIVDDVVWYPISLECDCLRDEVVKHLRVLPPVSNVQVWRGRRSTESQYIGYQRNTLQACRPRRTSSTHASSKVIQEGLESRLLGLIMRSKKPLFGDPFASFMPNQINFSALDRADPVGGRR